MTASFWIGSRPTGERVSLPRIMHSRISSAGPEAKAEARKRGARIAVSQKGRPGSPLYRKAVTVWMLTAQGMESRITGLIQCGRRHFLALGAQGDEGDESIQHQVAAERDHVPEHHRVRRRIE